MLGQFAEMVVAAVVAAEPESAKLQPSMAASL
jgi:hypothetical protein